MLKVSILLFIYIATKSSKVFIKKRKKKNLKYLDKVCMIVLGACIVIF